MVPIRKIYAVEISGACNLERTCTWCPMNNRPRSRARGIMNDETVVNALRWVRQLGAVDVLALHVFGEPLLHPHFDEIAARFAKFVPVTVSTNGVLLTMEWARRLAAVGFQWVSVSPWDKSAQQRAIENLTAVGIKTAEPPGATHNWAGQSGNDERVVATEPCPFLANGRGVIRWDGSIATCCISDRAEDAVGNVNTDQPESVSLRPYDICVSCHYGKA